MAIQQMFLGLGAGAAGGQQGSGDPWLDFSNQNVSTTRSFTFSTDGTKVYTCESAGSNDNYVLEFSLSLIHI